MLSVAPKVLITSASDFKSDGVRSSQSGLLWVTVGSGTLSGILIGDACKTDADCDDLAACSVDTCGVHGCERFWKPGCAP